MFWSLPFFRTWSWAQPKYGVKQRYLGPNSCLCLLNSYFQLALFKWSWDKISSRSPVNVTKDCFIYLLQGWCSEVPQPKMGHKTLREGAITPAESPTLRQPGYNVGPRLLMQRGEQCCWNQIDMSSNHSSLMDGLVDFGPLDIGFLIWKMGIKHILHLIWLIRKMNVCRMPGTE